MVTKRPTVLTVMGILNIILGSLFLLCTLCTGIFVLMMVNRSSIFDVRGVNVLGDMWDYMKREVPAYPAVTIGSVVEGLLADTLLVIAGIGLLNMQSWGRVLSIIYSVTTILMQVFTLIFTLAYVNPATERWQQDFARRVGGGIPAGGMGGDSTLNNIGSLVGTFFAIAYAVVLLIMMLQPRVGAAFAGPPPPLAPPDAGREDEGGDEYERQRRNPWGD
jgi:hypothetical protein